MIKTFSIGIGISMILFFERFRQFQTSKRQIMILFLSTQIISVELYHGPRFAKHIVYIPENPKIIFFFEENYSNKKWSLVLNTRIRKILNLENFKALKLSNLKGLDHIFLLSCPK